MTEFFIEKLHEVHKRSGGIGSAHFWPRTVLEVTSTAALEHVSTIRTCMRARTTPAGIARATT